MMTLTLTRSEAAALCGLTPSGFDSWVRRGIVPPPLMGTKRWSRVQLERALAGLPWVPPDTAIAEETDPWAEWQADQAERDKFKPLFDLNEREKSALRKLAARGWSNGKDIAGAAEKTFATLVRLGLAEHLAGVWRPSNEGKAEVARIETLANWHKR